MPSGDELDFSIKEEASRLVSNVVEYTGENGDGVLSDQALTDLGKLTYNLMWLM